MHIDLFVPHTSQYNVLHHFTIKLCEALQHRHQKSEALVSDMDKFDAFIQTVLERHPDYTLTFNSIAPDEVGNFLWDVLKIPHISWLVDSPNFFIDHMKGSINKLAKSHYSILACVDRDSCKIFEEIGIPNVLYLPHGVEKELMGDVDEKRPYDVVMLATPINFKNIRKEWKKNCPELVDVLLQAAELSFQNPAMSYIRAYAEVQKLTDGKGKISKKIIEHASILNSLEHYVRGFDKVSALKSIKKANVHVFGSSYHENNWNDVLGKQSNIIKHDAISFEETFEVMKKSKIVVNSCSWIRDGAHERIFSAMACGAVVITTRTPYLEENFVEGKEILFYDLNHWKNINEIVEYYLAHDKERKEIAMAGQKKVHRLHTWDNRAKTLIEHLSSISKEPNNP